MKILFLLALSFLLADDVHAQVQSAEPSNTPVPAFGISTPSQLLLNGIPLRLIGAQQSLTVEVAFAEIPSTRWNAAWGSYPQFVANTLRALGDQNARYEGNGKFRVSRGPRNILIDTIARFKTELGRRGLRLEVLTLERDITKNHSVGGDVNSDHLIGLAADGVVTARCFVIDLDCEGIGRNALEMQLRIVEAAIASGAQQLDLYGALRGVSGQSIHIGVSPFRNGSVGEMLNASKADGMRRIGYGGAQKGDPGSLSPAAAKYVGRDGTSMKSAFERLLHNAPPRGYESLYQAIRDRDLGKLWSIK